MIGVPASGPTTIIEAKGVTELVQVGNDYFMNPVSGGTGPEVMLYGSPVVAGQFPGWAPIGAEQTAGGYELAMELASTNQFIIWTLDSNGNYVTNTAAMSGTSTALETYETSFHQDLNGDGIIGVPAPTSPIASVSSAAPATPTVAGGDLSTS